MYARDEELTAFTIEVGPFLHPTLTFMVFNALQPPFHRPLRMLLYTPLSAYRCTVGLLKRRTLLRNAPMRDSLQRSPPLEGSNPVFTHARMSIRQPTALRVHLAHTYFHFDIRTVAYKEVK